MPPKMQDLFRTETTHVDEVNRRASMSRQWLLEQRNKPGDHPISVDNHLAFHICASHAFPHIVADMQAAKKSIDIICWGFDPGMELLPRKDGEWPRSLTYGDLLRQIGEQKIVTVRLLLWLAEGRSPSAWAGRMAHNLYGHPHWGKTGKSDPNIIRAKFCEQWWDDALNGRIPNLHVRYRAGDPAAVEASLIDEAQKLTVVEKGGLKNVSTHHQKPILIDYELPEQAIGYVMGLNSTTDYWDTPEHAYNDFRRGHASEGGADKHNPALRLKPFRDYAIRVRGHTLHCLNRNFVTAWDRAPRNADPFPETGNLQLLRQAIAPASFVLPSGAERQLAQIVRTQPEEGDKTIQEAYWLATSQARNYVYIENQYFQYAEWAVHLKDMRRRYAKGMRDAGCSTDVPNLYVFIVIPEAERANMVPRTYDTVAELGQGHTMATYDAAVQKQRKLMPAPEVPGQLDFMQYALPVIGPLNVLRAGRSAAHADVIASAARKQVSKADLDEMGLKVLIAKLYTQDPESEKCREIYIHSKLMIIDDVFVTLGSANMNLRSMAVDSEININCVHHNFAKDARRRVWGNLAGEDLDGGDGSALHIQQTHGDWMNKMKDNAAIVKGKPGRIEDFITTYSDPRGTSLTNVRLAKVPAVDDKATA
ncbi:phospholipase [Glaciimonas immobilis]|nr:phospholipase D-like domain-containing protein [Glaciimonas immobilis]KAF3995890.1 phospholipase [Glaciimonas immobilis]